MWYLRQTMHFYVVYVIINVYTRHTSDNSIINRQGVGMEKEVGFLHLNCCNGASRLDKLHIYNENIKWYRHLENSLEIPVKSQSTIPTEGGNWTFGKLSQRNKDTFAQGTSPHVYNNPIYNSQKRKSRCPSMAECDSTNRAPSTPWILSSKKEWTIDAITWMALQQRIILSGK